MKILYVVNMYPSKEKIHDGIFIKEQIEYCQHKYNIQYKVCLVDGIESRLNYLKSVFSINKLLYKEKFDLIHIHYGLAGIFLLFNPFIRVPAIVTLHGTDIQSHRKDGAIQRISRLVARRAQKVIVVNDNMLDILKDKYCKLSKIPCGINTQFFDLGRNNINNNEFVIGFPADKRRPVKNFQLFNGITKRLNDLGYKIRTIEFTNFTREQVAANLSKLDCLLMTSLSEGSPQIIKEAMVSEVPIISTNVGDVKSLLDGMMNCYVINSFAVEDFVEKIIELINLTPDKRKTNGKDKIKQLDVEQDSVCSKIFQLYTNLIDSNIHSKYSTP